MKRFKKRFSRRGRGSRRRKGARKGMTVSRGGLRL